MAVVKFHIDDNGNVKRCTASIKNCPKIHGDSKEEAMKKYEAEMNHVTIAPIKKSNMFNARKLNEFGEHAYYGELKPRDIQIDAMNGVVKALEKDDATQLIAACGTGKTYMQRQILNHLMEQEDSNKIGVILTSSIKLATDTANDLRPTNGYYDKTFGEYGEDYVVIEVHSDNDTLKETKNNSKGAISAEKIHDIIQKAHEDGKKIIIVSTYDSVSKVQEAQEAFGSKIDDYEADLIIHDEAHNILGQQRPTTVSDNDENKLKAYTGFHNDIPGSIQAKKRMYSTATPIIRESEGDKPSDSLEDAIKTAEKMRRGGASAQWERVTYYSDDEHMIGKMGGFISQQDAIDSGCLARPEYSVQQAMMMGRIKDFNDPVVNPDGTMIEREQSEFEHPLTPKTYGALVSTLNSLTRDGDGEINAPNNVLAYVGSIDQAEGFRDAFKKNCAGTLRGNFISRCGKICGFRR